MFENKNNPAPNLNPSPWFGSKEKSDLKNNAMESKTVSEAFTIHTMKDDMESLKNPYAQKSPEKMAAINAVTTPNPANNISAISDKKDKPFLSQANWDGNKAEFEKDKMFLKEETQKKNASGGKIFLWIIIVFVVLAVGAGSYYFWTTRVATQGPSAENIPSLPSQNQANAPVFSVDKANYLSVDIATLDKIGLKNVLKQNANKVLDSAISSPIEFIITDAKNNPVSFQDFSQKMEVALPSNILSLLQPNFSLFIYNDAGKARFGLAINSKDGNQLKIALLQEENKLTQDFGPLYLAPTYTPNNSAFKMSTYKNYAIRYNNVTSTENLSVDYTLRNNQWAIGTTQMTLHAILDYLDNQPTQTVPTE